MKVEILEKKRIFDRFFKIDEVLLRQEKYDGTMSGPLTRFSFERGDSVAVLLFCPDSEEVVLIEQYRYPAHSDPSGGWLLEIVAGSVGEGEDLRTAASKEVLEETGYSVSTSSLEEMSVFFASPGGTSERVHLYLARVSPEDQKGKGGGEESEDEDIKIINLPLAKALAMIQEGIIVDAKTIIALMMLEKRYNEKN